MAIKRRTGAVLALSRRPPCSPRLRAATSETPSGERPVQEPGDPDLVAQRHPGRAAARRYWQKVADDFTTLHPTVTIEIEADRDQRTPAHPDPGRAADQRPAGHLPGLGRRRDRRPGRRPATSRTSPSRPRPRSPTSAARPASGRSTASSTACRSASASRASGTTRRCSPQAGITAPPTTLDELNAAVTKLKADQRHPDRGRRR